MRVSLETMSFNNSAFSSRKDVMKKSEEFTDAIIREARHKNLTRNQINTIIHTYAPDVKLRLRKSSNKNINGTFAPSYIYGTDSHQFGFEERVLTVAPTQRGKISMAEYIRTLAHEMTHIFQSEDKDVGDLVFLEKNLPIMDNIKASNTLFAASSVWDYFEDRILSDVLNGYDRLRDANCGKSPFRISLNKKTLKECLDDVYKNIRRNFPDEDIEFIKKFIKLQLLHEADAYKAGAKAYKKYKRQPLTLEDLFPSKLYEAIERNI